MRQGIVLSILLHLFVIALTDVSLSDFLPKKDEVKAIKVHLVQAAAPKKSVAKKEVSKPKKSQQSAAPKAPPKKKDTPKPVAKKHETKVVSQKAIKQKVEEKKPPKEKKKDKAAAAKKEVKSPISRPEKLDKSKKVDEIKTSDPNAQKSADPDDFLAALEFAAQLEDEQQKLAITEGVETDEPVLITAEEEAEILIIKRHIEKNWYRNSGIKGLDEMSIHIELQINRDGTVSSMKMLQSSGSRSLDRSLERAVRKAQPLPIPGDKYDMFKVIDLYFNE